MDLNKYRLYCNTEQQNVETDYRESVPAVCPNNSEHSIDTNSIAIIDTVSDVPPVDPSGKERTHQTSRPLGMDTYFTGAGDDPENVSDVGGGAHFHLEHIADISITTPA